MLETTAPIHTSKLIDSRDEALAYPRGHIRLAACEQCGVITNTAFDAVRHDYSASYEETQSYSPRFLQFATGLARSLGEHVPRTGAGVLEIGCGRGDFLRILADVTGCRGVGIDPSFREGDLALLESEGLEGRKAFFSETDVDRPFDLVVCRHTLEHVHDVAGFLGLLRAGLAANAPNASIFFEVPDTGRIFGEVAFWDIFYEHCTYFTPGSLARAFRRAGFRPTKLELGFDRQYVLFTATIGAGGEGLPLEETPRDVLARASEFVVALDATKARWSAMFKDSLSRGDTTVLWGAGSKGVGFLSTLELREEIACVVDVNPAKQGRFMLGSGHQIVAPEALVDIRPRRVLIMNPVYLDEIREQISRLGLRSIVDAV